MSGLTSGILASLAQERPGALGGLPSGARPVSGPSPLGAPSSGPAPTTSASSSSPAATSGAGGSVADTKGRTVLGLPKNFLAAAREAGVMAPAGPAPAAAPAPALRTVVDADAGDDLDIDAEDDDELDTHRPTMQAQGLAPALTNLGIAPAPARPSEPRARDLRDARDTVQELARASSADEHLRSDPALKDTSPGHEVASPRGPTSADNRASRSNNTTRVLGIEAREIEAPRVRLVAGKEIPGTRYRLIRWLGEGGMGVVYEAEHIDIERRVAMKILRLDLSQHADTAKVFRDEARAANRVGSRNIVQIHDFGELPDGRLYFCMELLAGVDLTTYKDNGMEPGELCGVLRQVCKGLGAAHAADIVHRDIKPENILLVTEEGRPGLVKIVDFGVAAMLGGDSSGPIAGTPHYMSPEQITGIGFDGHLDQYAVGCMAYELLVSRPPFDGESIESVLMGHLKETPVPPSQIRPDRAVPPAIEAVILRCLAKEPSERYATMADLEAAVCEAQIAAGLHSAWDDLPLPDVDPDRRAWLVANMPGLFNDQRPQRPRWLWPALAGLAVLLSITGTALYMSRPPPPEMVSEVDALTQEAKDAALATHWVMPGEGEAPSTTAYAKILKMEAMGGEIADEADQRAGELRGEFASALDRLGDGLWSKGGQSFAATYYGWALVFDPADAHARERVPLTETELAMIRRRAETGDFLDAERRSAEIALAVITSDPEEKKTRLAAAFRGDDRGSLNQRSMFAEAARASGLVDGELLDEALGEPEEAAPTTGTPPPVEDDPPVDEVIPETVGKSGRSKRPKNDDAALEKAIHDPEKSQSLSTEGKAALARGSRAEAETLFNQALANDSRNTTALAGLSDIHFDRGNYQKSVSYAERAVKIASTDKSLRIKLGDGYFAVLRYSDALTQYERAQELGESRAAARIAKVKAKIGGG